MSVLGVQGVTQLLQGLEVDASLSQAAVGRDTSLDVDRAEKLNKQASQRRDLNQEVENIKNVI